MKKVISTLLHSVTQTHVFHLQTKSYSEHEALNEFYDQMTELVDRLAEGYQGKYGIQNYHSNLDIIPYKDKQQVINYLLQLDEIIQYNKPSESFLVSILDDIQELIYSTKYKLDNLQ